MLDLSQPRVMGILNVTPDSFSDGGNFFSTEKALARAQEMVREGAMIIDVGGESTRPGARAVGVQEELDRVIPVIEVLTKELPVIVSIDTSKSEVMIEAVAAGAGMINDVTALRTEAALQVAAMRDVWICLMHMQGEPRTMQQNPRYNNVVEDVKLFLKERIARCEAAGLSRKRLIVDPGFGFGKTVEQNLSLIKHLAAFAELGSPILVGVSRKSTVGTLLGAPVDQRLFGSIALATSACLSGASIIRAHDVKATYDALKICQALRQTE